MFSLLMAFASITGQAAATPVPAPVQLPAGRTLQQLPGATVSYYDVTGKNEKALTKSIQTQRPKDAAGQPLVAGNGWELGAKISKRTENGKCTIVAADITFKAKVELPRLANPQALKSDVRSAWADYFQTVEAMTAADMWFIHDRLPEIQKALVGLDCAASRTALDAAIAKLKAEESAFLARAKAELAAKRQQAEAKQQQQPKSPLAPTRY